MQGICLVIDNTPLYDSLAINPIAAPFDHDWLVVLAIGMWDHMQDQSDPVDDLAGWLRVHIPGQWNDLVCYTAGIIGCNYTEAAEHMVQTLCSITVNLVDLIEVLYGNFLSPFVYNAGWTISAVAHSVDGTIIYFTQTDLNLHKTASESLLFRLEQLYKRF